MDIYLFYSFGGGLVRIIITAIAIITRTIIAIPMLVTVVVIASILLDTFLLILFILLSKEEILLMRSEIIVIISLISGATSGFNVALFYAISRSASSLGIVIKSPSG